MRNVLQRAAALRFPAYTFPVVLLAICILSYGLLMRWFGFYWDDWAFTWISEQLGTAGLARYFSTNRPVWGLFYQLTTSILDAVPWQWQIFGLVWRWANALSLWWLLRLLWPRLPSVAMWTALLFAVYPGFDQQPIAITYGHFFIVLTAFFLSLGFTILALRRPQRFWLFTALALGLALVNLFAMEYFFLLELLRPLLIWIILSEQEPDRTARFKQTAAHAAPYLAAFAGGIIWRVFLFPYQTQNYEPALLNNLRAEPVQTLLSLAGRILADLWRVTGGAWGKAFVLPNPLELGGRTTQLYWLIVLAGSVLTAFYLMPGKSSQPAERRSGQVLLVGAAALLVAGWPFWLTELVIGLIFPNSRFTLPFILGTSLLIAGLLNLAPIKPWMKAGLLSILVGFAVGYQFQVANSYRRDWNLQRSLFWQMTWRMPHIEPGTTLLTNDLPAFHVSDNSLTSPLNLIYAPENTSQQMSYMLYYPTVRLNRGLSALEPGAPIAEDYLAARFKGSTSQIVAFVYQPPACVRVLDPALEPYNGMITPLMRSAAELSNPAYIHPAVEGEGAVPPASIFGAEPEHRWCYYYARAALAAQEGDWEAVVALGDTAFQLGDYPNDPMERVPFIEGYAQQGQWDRAVELARETVSITRMMAPVQCRLWDRIDRQAPESVEKGRALTAVRSEFACP